MKEKYMTEAAKEAYTVIENGHGGPFGSVIVKDDKIVGRGHNRVLYRIPPATAKWKPSATPVKLWGLMT